MEPKMTTTDASACAAAVGHVLRFRVVAGSDPLWAGSKATLWTNHPPATSPPPPFVRSKFYPVKADSHALRGAGDWIVELPITTAGSFQYYLSFCRSPSKDDQPCDTKGSMGYFVVDPALSINGKALPSNGMVIQTVLTKSMGPLSTWHARLAATAAAHYNIVHYTPLQQLGSSGSSYSLLHQLDFAPDLWADLPEASRPTTVAAKQAAISVVLSKLEQDHSLLAFTDIVWNHTADNSPWLIEHPEAGYNLNTAPYLRSAFELDEALQTYSGTLPANTTISSAEDVAHHIQRLRSEVLPALKLWEYFVLDVEASMSAVQSATPDPEVRPAHSSDSAIVALRDHGVTYDPCLERKSRGLKAGFVAALYQGRSMDELRNHLNTLNVEFYNMYDGVVAAVLSNLANSMAYVYLDPDGIKRGKMITEAEPIVSLYFIRLPGYKDGPGGGIHPDRVLVCNGWLWGANPSDDFAAQDSLAFLKREVIIWGDCVKLRYGNGPSDNPWLWSFMADYTKRQASLFRGFRVDNAHSTPIHVAEYMLDAARAVQPNLYVTAELFTGSESVDREYVRRLGLNSLIREAMAPANATELGSALHRYGAQEPVGGLRNLSHVPRAQPLTPPALLFDMTHDNKAPVEARTTLDALSTAALVAMSDVAIGSNWGFDLLLPSHVPVVGPTPLYPEDLPSSNGILRAKAVLNALHTELAADGYSQTHIHQDGALLSVYRHSPSTEEGVLLIAHTAFDPSAGYHTPHATFTIHGVVTALEYAATLEVQPPTRREGEEGLTGKQLLRKSLTGAHSSLISATDLKEATFTRMMSVHGVDDNLTQVKVHEFPPGSIAIFRVAVDSPSLSRLRSLLTLWEGYEGDAATHPCSWCDKVFVNLASLKKHVLKAHPDVNMEELVPPGPPVDKMSLLDLQILFYRCAAEEQDAVERGVYDVPGFGPLVYAGIAGFAVQLQRISRVQDMGHPLCDNLRAGDWAMDYVSSRLSASENPALVAVGEWLDHYWAAIRPLPRNLVPKYVHIVIMTLFRAAQARGISLMSPFVRASGPWSWFVRNLAMNSVALYSVVPSAPLLRGWHGSASLAAGLPHFCVGYMRAWGRDTFISLPGLFLVTGRFREAKTLLLAFAGATRHGLIPNLLDGGSSPRYNSRDATWFWMEAVQRYCQLAPEGNEFLKAPVSRLWALDRPRLTSESEPELPMSLAEVIQEILAKHAAGIHFREWNAGPQIDDRMQDAGFNVDISLDPNTGVLYGGNEWNCGTWMDKMGESHEAGTFGVPATPRDGAAIEITALLKSCVRWLSSLPRDVFPYQGVETEDMKLDYADWNKRLEASFEKLFWVPETPEEDSQYQVDPSVINRRGIYKDTVGSTSHWGDYQLRPNVCVAMSVAPELFNPSHAGVALNMIEEVLLGPYGMKTLDPSDMRYRANYDNGNTNAADPAVTRGFNYHNGPEWLWPTGYFLRASLIFGPQNGRDISEVRRSVNGVLERLRGLMKGSPWIGLPELTNGNGEFCRDSCPIQAWSAATLLEVYHDLAALNTE